MNYESLIAIWEIMYIERGWQALHDLLIKEDNPPSYVRETFVTRLWRLEVAMRLDWVVGLVAAFTPDCSVDQCKTLSPFLGVVFAFTAAFDAAFHRLFNLMNILPHMDLDSFTRSIVYRDCENTNLEYMFRETRLIRLQKLVPPNYHGLVFDHVLRHAAAYSEFATLRALGRLLLVSPASFVAQRIVSLLVVEAEELIVADDAYEFYESHRVVFRACMPAFLASYSMLFTFAIIACAEDVRDLFTHAYQNVKHVTDEMRSQFVILVRAKQLLAVEWMIVKYGDSLLCRDDQIPIEWREAIFMHGRAEQIKSMAHLLVEIGFPLDFGTSRMNLFEFLYAPCDGTNAVFDNGVVFHYISEFFATMLMAIGIFPQCFASVEKFARFVVRGNLRNELELVSASIPLKTLRMLHSNIVDNTVAFPMSYDEEELRTVAIAQMFDALLMVPDPYTPVHLGVGRMQWLMHAPAQFGQDIATTSWKRHWRRVCIAKGMALAWLDFPVLVTIEIFDAMAPQMVQLYLPYHFKWDAFKAIKDKINRREGRIV